jgi:hypothetical protein
VCVSCGAARRGIRIGAAGLAPIKSKFEIVFLAAEIGRADGVFRGHAVKPWSRSLAYPITLRDGCVSSIMAQAAHLITQRLPKARQEKPV